VALTARELVCRVEWSSVCFMEVVFDPTRVDPEGAFRCPVISILLDGDRECRQEKLVFCQDL